ncbi:Hypothetical predicted protein [Mytilus galloprovincialis]|uniref:Mab-21-like HhH/H2TH-like domain-containing protein n=1 Tax=Mytilus galloprovincialis TaxID=29158 RepID=A0A8B6G8I7_MYTGA|nr:Hypothetical predicted protein [Mytilus galloprovincialis]
MVDISLRLYDYLCESVVGSENIVVYRRQFFDVHDDFLNCSGGHLVEYITSGSKAEGLDFPDSDLDIMLVHKITIENNDFKGTNAKYKHMDRTFLYLDVRVAQPGFGMIRIDHTHPCLNKDIIKRSSSAYLMSECVVVTDIGTFLSGKLWKTINANLNFKIMPIKINGPCLTTLKDSMDLALALPCDNWGNIAESFFTRSRSSYWPPEKIIEKIRQKGFLLVPVGSKSDSVEDNPLEWRISFSQVEKLLIRSWNHTQFVCYALLKLFIKEVVKKAERVDKLICSYFLKTTILWISEELPLSTWSPQNLIKCFMSCLQRLIYWNMHEYIPNYFIPEHNMIDRKFEGQPREALVAILKKKYDIGWFSVLECHSLKEFHCFYTAAKVAKSEYEFDIATMPLLEIFEFFPNVTQITGNTNFKFCFDKVSNSNVPFMTRNMYLLRLICLSEDIADHTFYESHQKTNKNAYTLRRKWLCPAIIATYKNSLSGWLRIALSFFFFEQYNEALTILDYGRLTCTVEKLFTFNGKECRQFYSAKQQNTSMQKNTVLEDIRLRTMRKFIVWSEPHTANETHPFIHLATTVRKIHCPSVVFMYYLRFLCFFNLKDITQFRDSLRSLHWTVKTIFCIERVSSMKNRACLYLSRAYRIIGKEEEVSFWLSVAERVKDKSSRNK